MNAPPPSVGQPLAALAGVLPQGALLTAEADLARYSRDWSGDHFGRPLAVARPGSVDEVAALHAPLPCRAHPGRAAGRPDRAGRAPRWRADSGELVISLERLNKVRSVSAIDFAMVVEAGCILEDAKRAAEAAGLPAADHLRRTGQLPDRRQCRHQCRRLQRAALRHDARPRARPRGGAGRRPRLERAEGAAQGQSRLRSEAAVHRQRRHARHRHRRRVETCFRGRRRSRPRWSACARSRTRWRSMPARGANAATSDRLRADPARRHRDRARPPGPISPTRCRSPTRSTC